MISFELKKRMKEQGKTLKKLSDETGISMNSLSLLSTGKSKGLQFDTLDKILNSLDIPIEDLIIHYNENETSEIRVHTEYAIGATRLNNGDPIDMVNESTNFQGYSLPVDIYVFFSVDAYGEDPYTKFYTEFTCDFEIESGIIKNVEIKSKEGYLNFFIPFSKSNVIEKKVEASLEQLLYEELSYEGYYPDENTSISLKYD